MVRTRHSARGRSHAPSAGGTQTLFVVGTSTGVGKTLLTGLLLSHLRTAGYRALAIKPFATGSSADADLLDSLQGGELPRPLLNPFFFPKPVAPLVAARAAGCTVPPRAVLDRMQAAAARCDLLLVEGCGGLLTPLGEAFSLLDLIRQRPGPVVIVAQNRLGVLHQVLSVHHALRGAKIETVAAVLMGVRSPDMSANTNAAMLRELAARMRVVECPYLGGHASRPAVIRKAAARLDQELAGLARFAFGLHTG